MWAEFRKNTGQTTSEGGSCDETTSKKVITFYHFAGRQFLKKMTKKVSFLSEKGWHRQLSTRVTPTLVTLLLTFYWDTVYKTVKS